MADPQAIAASMSGLTALAGEMAEMSRRLSVSIKHEQQLFQHLQTDIEALQASLHDASAKVDGSGNHLGDAMMRNVLERCAMVMQRLQNHLLFLQDAFSRAVSERVRLRSEIMATLRDVAETREQLQPFKTTIHMALQLRDLCVYQLFYIDKFTLTDLRNRAQSQTAATSIDAASLRADLLKLAAQSSYSSEPSYSAFDARQYVDFDHILLEKLIDNIAILGSGETSVPSSEAAAKTLDSFEAWLNSTHPHEQSAPASGFLPPTQDSSLKHSKIRLRVTGLNKAGAPGEACEEIDLAMTDYVGSAVEALLEKGNLPYHRRVPRVFKLTNN